MRGIATDPKNPAPPLPPDHCPGWLERALLTLAILLKLACYWRQRGTFIGYDMGDHLGRMVDISWWSPAPPMHLVFYGYHPPLGFFLPHLLFGWLGESIHAVQAFSTLCSLAAFIFLRLTLRHLDLLRHWGAVTVLYLWAGLPIIVNCGVSINLDLPLLAWMSAVLWFSALLWHGDGLKKTTPRVLAACGLILSLAAGMMTKFSGLLAFPIPVLGAMVFGHGRWRSATRAILLALLALALVFPYYWNRYYQTEGTFFPRNNEWFSGEEIRQAAQIRDADRTGFLLRLFAPDFLQPPHPAQARDLQAIRLFDAWRDFFIRDDRLYFSPHPGPGEIPRGIVLCGRIYRGIFSLLTIAGLILWLKTRKDSPLSRLGFIFLPLALMFAGSLASYCYVEAVTSCSAAKGIYILPVTWSIAWLAGLALTWLLRNKGWLISTLLSVWLLVNHLWPVY